MSKVFKMQAPPEPGSEVTRLQEFDAKPGSYWERGINGWHYCDAEGFGGDSPWAEVVEIYGPLIDITPPRESPRAWSVPEEPPKGTKVQDSDGDVWMRGPDGRWRTHGNRIGVSWGELFAWAPLTEVIEEKGKS